MRIRPHFKNGRYSAVTCSMASGSMPAVYYYWLNAYLEDKDVHLAALPKLAVRLTWRCPLWVKSGRRISARRCPLYSQTRTWPSATRMSAKCHKQTHALQQKRLLNDLIGDLLQMHWHIEA